MRETIESWAADFAAQDALTDRPAALREHAAAVLAAFLDAACARRGVEPGDVEEADLRAGLLEGVAPLALPEAAHAGVPALCADFLAWLQGEGRLGGGRQMGAFVRALAPGYAERASGKRKPDRRPGSKLGRNDPCPCGSGKKYKKCCGGAT